MVWHNQREREMAWRSIHQNALPVAAMVTVECTNVGLNVLFKAATSKGLSYYVFIVYSNAIATLVLLPLFFIFRRSSISYQTDLSSFVYHPTNNTYQSIHFFVSNLLQNRASFIQALSALQSFPPRTNWVFWFILVFIQNKNLLFFHINCLCLIKQVFGWYLWI